MDSLSYPSLLKNLFYSVSLCLGGESLFFGCGFPRFVSVVNFRNLANFAQDFIDKKTDRLKSDNARLSA